MGGNITTIKERARELYKEYLSEIHDMSDMLDTSALMTLCLIEALKEMQQPGEAPGFPKELGSDMWTIYREKIDEKIKNGEIE
ncbi:MAG TPA: hypothetical protein HA367_01315 [Candidatus Methanofastidiosum sp.]|nr:hypothetical protein [Methanofastidiosum sp.]